MTREQHSTSEILLMHLVIPGADSTPSSGIRMVAVKGAA